MGNPNFLPIMKCSLRVKMGEIIKKKRLKKNEKTIDWKILIERAAMNVGMKRGTFLWGIFSEVYFIAAKITLSLQK